VTKNQHSENLKIWIRHYALKIRGEPSLPLGFLERALEPGKSADAPAGKRSGPFELRGLFYASFE